MKYIIALLLIFTPVLVLAEPKGKDISKAFSLMSTEKLSLYDFGAFRLEQLLEEVDPPLFINNSNRKFSIDVLLEEEEVNIEYLIEVGPLDKYLGKPDRYSPNSQFTSKTVCTLPLLNLQHKLLGSFLLSIAEGGVEEIKQKREASKKDSSPVCEILLPSNSVYRAGGKDWVENKRCEALHSRVNLIVKIHEFYKAGDRYGRFSLARCRAKLLAVGYDEVKFEHKYDCGNTDCLDRPASGRVLNGKTDDEVDAELAEYIKKEYPKGTPTPEPTATPIKQ